MKLNLATHPRIMWSLWRVTTPFACFGFEFDDQRERVARAAPMFWKLFGRASLRDMVRKCDRNGWRVNCVQTQNEYGEQETY